MSKKHKEAEVVESDGLVLDQSYMANGKIWVAGPLEPQIEAAKLKDEAAEQVREKLGRKMSKLRKARKAAKRKDRSITGVPPENLIETEIDNASGEPEAEEIEEDEDKPKKSKKDKKGKKSKKSKKSESQEPAESEAPAEGEEGDEPAEE